MPRKRKYNLSRDSSRARAAKLARTRESSAQAELRRQRQVRRQCLLRACETTSQRQKRLEEQAERQATLRKNRSCSRKLSSKHDNLPVIITCCPAIERVQIQQEGESSEDAAIKDRGERTNSSSSEDYKALNRGHTIQSLSIWKHCTQKSKFMTADTSKQDETELLITALNSLPNLIDYKEPGFSKGSWDDLVDEINPNKSDSMKCGPLPKKQWSDLKHRINKRFRPALRSQDVEKDDKLNGFDNMIMEILEVNRSPSEDNNILNYQTIPPSTSVQLSEDAPPSEVSIAGINVKQEVIVPDEIPFSRENIDTSLLTQTASGSKDPKYILPDAVLEEEVDLSALKSHPELIHKQSSDVRKKKLWRKVAKQLNLKGSGIWRSTRAVQQKWTSLKCRVKKKYMAIQQSKFALKDLKDTVVPLSNLDKKVLTLLDIDYSKDIEMENSNPLPTNGTETVGSASSSVHGTTPVINGTHPAVNGATSVVNGTTLIISGTSLTTNGAALSTSSPTSAINYAIPLVNATTPAVTSIISNASLVSSGIPPTINATTERKGITPIVNVAESNKTRERSPSRVNFYCQAKRRIQQKREDKFLTLERESLNLKKHTLEEHRKTNVLLQRILLIKSEDM